MRFGSLFPIEGKDTVADSVDSGWRYEFEGKDMMCDVVVGTFVQKDRTFLERRR